MASNHRQFFEISPMGESAILITFGNRISQPLIDRVHAFARVLRDRAIEGAIDIVPGYASVLIAFDQDSVEEASLLETLGRIAFDTQVSSAAKAVHGRKHTIPVAYGGDAGPDLDEVARRHNMSLREVVRLHTGHTYTVAFIGFLPGFPYMASLANRIASPRLATPRARIPGGSVGLAGVQTAIYPFASPGGWRIIGRTSLPIWNPFRKEPALLMPGDQVRFAESQYESVAPRPPSPPNEPRSAAFQVVEPGALTTIQDLGRPGLAHLGIGRGGAFDPFAAQRANALVGNDPNAAVLETTWLGPTLLALRNVTIAFDGADLGCRADGIPIPPGLSWFIRTGTLLTFSPNSSGYRGVRAYLAVSGGFDVPEVLGSRSTSMLAGFGGMIGRSLQTGDILGIGEMAIEPLSVAGNNWPGQPDDISRKPTIIRFIPFDGPQAATQGAKRTFVDGLWELTEQADRMGYRFRPSEGPPLPTGRDELVSFGVVKGAIQLPGSGHPIVLNVDCQTTGGYPLLGVVAEADFRLLAQLGRGDQVRFYAVSLEEARQASRIVREELRSGQRLLGKTQVQ